MSPDPITPPRAGFWRRAPAFTIDGLIVTLPFQIIGAVLFAMSSGWIQQSGGITSASCAVIEKAPKGLVPPPPANSNFGRQCTMSLLGHVTAKWLQIGRVTKEGSTTTTISQTYMLNREGEPINGVSIDWITEIVLIFYLLAMGMHGATLGDSMMNIRIIDTASPGSSRVPLRKIIVRYLALFIGFIPMFATLLIFGVMYGFNAEAMAANGFFTWFQLASIPAFGWVAWILIQIVRKRDPIYDQIGGTAVVRN